MNSLGNQERSGNDCAGSTFPDPFRRPSARLLCGPVPEAFEAFYRVTLRHCSGVRLRTLQVASLYAAWAGLNGAPSLNLRQVKRAMRNIGHAHLHSNGTYFADVQLASAAPHLRDNFPNGPPPAREFGIVERIEQIALDLEQLRRAVSVGLK